MVAYESGREESFDCIPIVKQRKGNSEKVTVSGPQKCLNPCKKLLSLFAVELARTFIRKDILWTRKG